MRTIWHIIKKDLVHNRWLLLAMAGVLVAKAAMLYSCFFVNGDILDLYTTGPIALNGMSAAEIIIRSFIPGHYGFYQIVYMFGSFVDTYLLLIIISRALEEDSAIDERSFWRTRPMSRGQMLAAKAIFIGVISFPLLYILQVIVDDAFLQQLTIFRASDYAFYSKLSALQTAMITQACWVGAAILLATLWRSRLIGIGVIVLSALAISFLFGTFRIWTYRVDEMGLFFLLLYNWLASATVIAVMMYMKSNRALGYSLYAIMIVAFLIIVLIP